MIGEIVVGGLLLLLVVIVIAALVFQYDSVHPEVAEGAKEHEPTDGITETRKPLSERVKPFEVDVKGYDTGRQDVAYGFPVTDKQ